MKFATFDSTTKELSAPIAVVIAIIGIVPALVTLGVNYAVKPADKPAQELEVGKLALEKRKASADVYKSALKSADFHERHRMVQFLMTAKLVDDNADVKSLPPERVPQWPAQPAQ